MAVQTSSRFCEKPLTKAICELARWLPVSWLQISSAMTHNNKGAYDFAHKHVCDGRQQTKQSLAEWKAAKEHQKQQAAAEQHEAQEHARQVMCSTPHSDSPRLFVQACANVQRDCLLDCLYVPMLVRSPSPKQGCIQLKMVFMHNFNSASGFSDVRNRHKLSHVHLHSDSLHCICRRRWLL